MEQESIQCDGCHSWLHQHCIQMTLTQYVDYSDKAFLQFYCWRCCCDAAGRFNFLASLSRIASCAPDVSAMRLQEDSELKLLTKSCCLRWRFILKKALLVILCQCLCCRTTVLGCYSTLQLLVLVRAATAFSRSVLGLVR